MEKNERRIKKRRMNEREKKFFLYAKAVRLYCADTTNRTNEDTSHISYTTDYIIIIAILA